MRSSLDRMVGVLAGSLALACTEKHVDKGDLVGTWRATPESIQRLAVGAPAAKDSVLELSPDGTFEAWRLPSRVAALDASLVDRANGTWRLEHDSENHQIVELEYRVPGRDVLYVGQLFIETDRKCCRLYFNLSDPDLRERFIFERH